MDRSKKAKKASFIQCIFGCCIGQDREDEAAEHYQPKGQPQPEQEAASRRYRQKEQFEIESIRRLEADEIRDIGIQYNGQEPEGHKLPEEGREVEQLPPPLKYEESMEAEVLQNTEPEADEEAVTEAEDDFEENLEAETFLNNKSKTDEEAAEEAEDVAEEHLEVDVCSTSKSEANAEALPETEDGLEQQLEAENEMEADDETREEIERQLKTEVVQESQSKAIDEAQAKSKDCVEAFKVLQMIILEANEEAAVDTSNDRKEAPLQAEVSQKSKLEALEDVTSADKDDADDVLQVIAKANEEAVTEAEDGAEKYMEAYEVILRILSEVAEEVLADAKEHKEPEVLLNSESEAYEEALLESLDVAEAKVLLKSESEDEDEALSESLDFFEEEHENEVLLKSDSEADGDEQLEETKEPTDDDQLGTKLEEIGEAHLTEHQSACKTVIESDEFSALDTTKEREKAGDSHLSHVLTELENNCLFFEDPVLTQTAKLNANEDSDKEQEEFRVEPLPKIQDESA